MTDKAFAPYTGPAGGWGSVGSLGRILLREHVPISGPAVLAHQNKATGFMCTSCAWAKPVETHPFEFCENGAKATAWDMTTIRCTPAFFAKHSVTALRGWDAYHLEQAGRLTHPMRYDTETDRYLPTSWQSAFAEIGRELRAMPDRKGVVFYASGRASLETSYMYGLLARMYGNNNLPDSSNMCHESTSVALPESIGVPVGTVHLDDFKSTDCILFFGQNVGSNAPRMLHQLREVSKRGVPIITYNPLRERGLERFTDPQSPIEMLTGKSTRITSSYHQVMAGGDIAALMGICKALIAMDDAARSASKTPVLDHAFIARHTHGFEAFAETVRVCAWAEIERRSALTQAALESTAATYAQASACIAIYGMGLTQHKAGVEAVQMLVNLLLLRGNIGKPGAGICPVRGHSNVQGQRTVGITEKPELVPMDKIAAQFGFSPPRDKGLNTVEACEKIISGDVRGFIALGGNFISAVPERTLMEAAWPRLRLSVQIATKLNRSHLVHGEISYILPCLSRIEIDRQASGAQTVSMESSVAFIHGSKGVREPASAELLSEPAIVAGIAEATLPPNPHLNWTAWVADYRRIRAAIVETYPENFEGYETRMTQKGGFPRPVPARERIWKTKNAKANFIVPGSMAEDADMPDDGPDTLRMITLRSNDQFNTTVYGYDDRFRGIHGTRMVVLMHRNDIARLALVEGQMIGLETVAHDGVARAMSGFRVTPYDIPAGCIGTYYPEANALIPLWHHADRAKVPAAKSVPVRVTT